MASGESDYSFTKRAFVDHIDDSCAACLHGYAIWQFGLTCFHVGAAGVLVGNLLLDTEAEEPKITRRDRAEMEEFETRLEGDFISRDGLREGVENLVREDLGGDKLEGAKSQSISLGRGKADSKKVGLRLALARRMTRSSESESVNQPSFPRSLSSVLSSPYRAVIAKVT
jgi:hypothetical protein